MSKRYWLLIIISGAILFSLFVPLRSDFVIFYTAAQYLTHGHNPYDVMGFFSPIWVAVLFTPYTLLPYALAEKLHAVIAFTVYGVAVLNLSRKSTRPALLALCFIPFLWYTVLWGNIEYMVLIAVFLSAPLGLWLVLAKPQMGLFIAVIMLLEYYQQHSIKRTIAIAMPLIAASLLSVALGMFQHTPVNVYWNDALWPWGLIGGLPLAVYALWRRDRVYALAASVLCMPYLLYTSWCALLPACFHSRFAARGALLIALTLMVWLMLRKNIANDLWYFITAH